MAYTSINKSTDHFEAKTYDGTGASRTLAFDFEVDLFWCKMRNDIYAWRSYDVVRGDLQQLQPDQTNANRVAGNTVSFDNASGVTLGSDSGNYGVNQALNDSSQTANYIGYGWKADNTSGSSNTDGSITSTVSANTTSGFSLVSYTGTGSNATVGHGLGSAPAFMIVKSTSTTDWWITYHKSNGATKYMPLNFTNSVTTNSAIWNDTEPTSSVFSIGTNGGTNGSGNTYIAYCFAEKKGFSKFGSYSGNNSNDGPFVYLGFKPAWILFKATDSGQYWHLLDNKRDTANDEDASQLSTNTSATESTVRTDRGVAKVDFLSNGFKIRSDGSSFNGTNNMIYMAFAESPFTTSTGVPTTAR